MVLRRRILDRASHAEKKKEERSGERERERERELYIHDPHQTTDFTRLKSEGRGKEGG